ncbi:helix-turn-helix domain-containing protein [Paucisalibacillus sp. EB02]|uniref:helix-turn-helix domain-containing protein n=1 Tax=Paucisalibacillus sp. EB02 TaxID=1347087 RepID=UPI0004BA817B|nr:helix-turn-helix domain-containing protein [Paucisalibacillus sp. EB02]
MKGKNKDIENIINDFEFKIKKSLNNTSYQEREDLEQEIKTKIIEKIHSVELGEAPSFWWLINKKRTS